MKLPKMKYGFPVNWGVVSIVVMFIVLLGYGSKQAGNMKTDLLKVIEQNNWGQVYDKAKAQMTEAPPDDKSYMDGYTRGYAISKDIHYTIAYDIGYKSGYSKGYGIAYDRGYKNWERTNSPPKQ